MEEYMKEGGGENENDFLNRMFKLVEDELGRSSREKRKFSPGIITELDNYLKGAATEEEWDTKYWNIYTLVENASGIRDGIDYIYNLPTSRNDLDIMRIKGVENDYGNLMRAIHKVMGSLIKGKRFEK